MWYFTWILGVLLACSFGIINALWLETTQNLDEGDAGDRCDALAGVLSIGMLNRMA